MHAKQARDGMAIGESAKLRSSSTARFEVVGERDEPPGPALKQTKLLKSWTAEQDSQF